MQMYSPAGVTSRPPSHHHVNVAPTQGCFITFITEVPNPAKKKKCWLKTLSRAHRKKIRGVLSAYRMDNGICPCFLQPSLTGTSKWSQPESGQVWYILSYNGAHTLFTPPNQESLDGISKYKNEIPVKSLTCVQVRKE